MHNFLPDIMGFFQRKSGFQVVVTEPLLGLFPSMASFFFLHIVHRKGPSHRLDVEEMIAAASLLDTTSLGDWSIWHTAHFNSPVSVLEGTSFPNLYFQNTNKD